jgi:hypothetical protein
MQTPSVFPLFKGKNSVNRNESGTTSFPSQEGIEGSVKNDFIENRF